MKKNALCIFFLLLVDIAYFSKRSHCPYNSQDKCFRVFFLQEITTTGLCAFLALIGLCYTLLLLYSFLQKNKLCTLVNISNLMFLLKIEKNSIMGPQDYTKLFHGILFEFLQIWIVMAFLMVISVWLCKRNQSLLSLIVFFSALLILSSLLSYELTLNRYWTEGIDGKRLQYVNDEGFQYCTLKFPEKDWKNVIEGKVDLTYYIDDCTKRTYVQTEIEKHQLEKYIDIKNKQFITFPDLTKIPNPFSREETQQFIFRHALTWEDDHELPQTEYILNLSTNEYLVKVSQNKSLVEERRRMESIFLSMMESKQRKPLKNLLVIYIDALSRRAFPIKLPKCFRWFHEHKLRNNNNFLFQGLRAHSIGTYTYHNALAYYYAASSQSSDVEFNSPFSLINKTLNYKWVEEINKRTGRKQLKKQMSGQRNYSHFVGTLQNAGFQYSWMSSTDCSTSPLTQEALNLTNFLEPIIYDHMGIIPSCDPNYYSPDAPASGPYSVMRRCLYGKEMIDYSLTYAQEFLTTYSQQPKYFALELIEAHERTQEVIKYQDDKIYAYLQFLEESGHLDESLLMFISDHGIHMNSIIEFEITSPYNLNPDIGFPLLILVLPNGHLTSEERANLLNNEQKLTTLFELHYLIKYFASTEDDDNLRRNSLVGRIPTNRTSYDLPDIDVNPKCCLLPQNHD